MARQHTIVAHPQRGAIDTAILAGESYRNICARFGIASTRTVTEYRRDHLTAAANRNASTHRNTVHCLRDEDLLARLPEGSIDVWWSSPPYNLADKFRGGNSVKTQVRLQYAGGSGRGDGFLLPEDQYQAWQVRVLDEWHRTLADGGLAFYSHKPRHKGGRLIVPTEWVQRSRLVLVDCIYWARPGTAQNDPRRPYPCLETILVLAKRPGARMHNPGRQSGGEGLLNVWYDVLPEGTRLQRGHPCTTPAELLRRCLSLVPPPRAGRRLLVADCYAGSGTTGAVAQALGMDYVLADISAANVELMRRRLTEGATTATATTAGTGQREAAG